MDLLVGSDGRGGGAPPRARLSTLCRCAAARCGLVRAWCGAGGRTRRGGVLRRYYHPRSWESISFRIGRGKVTLRAAGSDLCRCRSNLARAQFRATGQRDGGHATTCTPAGAPRVQLRRPEESAPKSCRAATHGKPLSSVGPQRSRFLTLFHHSDRRRQERLHGLDRPPAGAGRPRASMPGTVRRVVPFSSEADRSNGGTLASPLSRPCRARRP